MICSQCGTENSPGDKFCEQCGAPLQSSAEEGAAATVVGAPPEAAVLVRDDDASQTFTLGNRAIVGRLDTCDIPIHDKSVSREHARLSQLPGGYVLEDLGSTNGTFVNGQRLQEAVVVRPGDTVTFGSIEFHLQGQGAEPSGARPVEPSPPSFSRQPEPEPPPWSQPAAPSQPEQPQPAPAFDFPPLQPFTPQPQPSTSQSGQEPAVIPFRESGQASAPVEAEPSAPWPSQQQAQPEVAPPAPPEPVIPPPQPVETTSPPVETEPQPAESEPQPSEAQPVASTGGAAPSQSVAPPPAPQSSGLEGDWANLSDEAVAAAAHLADLVGSLAQRLSETQGRLEESEQAGGSMEAVRQALSQAPEPSVQSDQLQSLQGSLEQLIQQPRDIEVLMQVGRQAADLASVVSEYGQMRQTLDQAREAAGS